VGKSSAYGYHPEPGKASHSADLRTSVITPRATVPPVRTHIVIPSRHFANESERKRCCRSTFKLEVSEATKLALCHSVPRHPASSTASPRVTWLSSWIKCRLIRRPAAPLTALSIVSPTAVTDYSFVGWRLEAGPWFDQPLRAQRDGDSTAPMHTAFRIGLHVLFVS
jgi:hypothetical protein